MFSMKCDEGVQPTSFKGKQKVKFLFYYELDFHGPQSLYFI